MVLNIDAGHASGCIIMGVDRFDDGDEAWLVIAVDNNNDDGETHTYHL